MSNVPPPTSISSTFDSGFFSRILARKFSAAAAGSHIVPLTLKFVPSSSVAELMSLTNLVSFASPKSAPAGYDRKISLTDPMPI